MSNKLKAIKTVISFYTSKVEESQDKNIMIRLMIYKKN